MPQKTELLDVSKGCILIQLRYLDIYFWNGCIVFEIKSIEPTQFPVL